MVGVVHGEVLAVPGWGDGHHDSGYYQTPAGSMTPAAKHVQYMCNGMVYNVIHTCTYIHTYMYMIVKGLAC